MRVGIRLVSLQAIVALVIFVATAATIGSALFIYHGRTSAVERAQGELRNYAFVLAEQTEQALQAVEVVQKDIIARIRYSLLFGDRDFNEIGTSEPIFAALAEKANELPHVRGLAIVRADGITLATSQGRAGYRPYDVSGREYFRNVIADPTVETKISPVIASLLTNRETIMVSRKITSSRGLVLGVINAALELEYFNNLYGRLVGNSQLETALLRADGSPLVTFPTKPSATPLNADILDALKSQDQARTANLVGGDGEARLAAVKASSSFPVAIVVSDAYSSILSTWKLHAGAIAGTAILMNIAIAFAWYLGRRQMNSSVMRAATESYLARHDVLTKSPNRLYFLEEMRRTIDASVAQSREFALFVIDLNRFKEINDTLGHPTGDLMIQSIAGRLKEAIGDMGFVARIGGDEFAIILQDAGAQKDVEAFAGEVVAKLEAPHQIDERVLQCRCSIGIAIGPTHGATADDLLKAADLALYAVKATPKLSYRFYDAEVNAERLKRRDLENALPHAVENNEFELFYQPIVSLKTGRYWGFEALVRWRRPGHGMVPPNTFIPTLEDMGLIIALGQKILVDACVAASKWPVSKHVAVNVSPIQLASDEVIDHIRGALEVSQLKPSRLTIEVTESVLLGEGAIERLRAIRELGVSIALDDFGTGFASMSYLQRYPYQKIKIDRSFVANLSDPKSQAIVTATINLAQALKIETTAEGVETVEQLEALRRAGASQAQGYLFAKPMPENDIPAFLSQTRLLKPAPYAA